MLKKVNKITETSEMHNAFSQTTEIVGNIATKDDMRFDGNIQGDIVSEKKIVVGETAVINGNIRCVNLDSLGLINGDVHCEEGIVLRSGSRFKGTISVKSLEVEPGALFDGSCSMHE